MSRCFFALFMILGLVGSAGSAGAGEWMLTNGNSTVYLDDSSVSGVSPGVFSWAVDNSQRINQQAFYYRIGTTSPEFPVGGDELDPSAHFSVTGTRNSDSSVTLTFDEKAGRFSMDVTYVLIGGTSGRSTLEKNVSITNHLKDAPLDFHLFSYSDYDLKTGIYLHENAAIVNDRAYQASFASETDAVGSGATLVESATKPPSRYGIDNNQFLDSLANGVTPYDLENFAGPYPAAGDTQFALQWDLTINPESSTSFTITDEIFPTKTLNLAGSASGTCVNYGEQFTYTYTFDNANNPSKPANNVLLSEKPAPDISLVSATPGGIYDAATGAVTWSIPQLAAGAIGQTVQGTFMVNSVTDFTMVSQVVSDETFPSSLSEKLVLCNHPPFFTSLPITSVTEGNTYRYQVAAIDLDAASKLTFNLDEGPTGMTISANGEISWLPPYDVVGTHPVRVSISDGALSASQNFTVRVNAGFPDGDVNGDRIVDLADVITALRIVVGIEAVTPARLTHGDVAPQVSEKPVPDGALTIQDAFLLMKKVIGLLKW